MVQMSEALKAAMASAAAKSSAGSNATDQLRPGVIPIAAQSDERTGAAGAGAAGGNAVEAFGQAR